MPVDELNLHRATVGGGKGANLAQTEGRARSPPVKLVVDEVLREGKELGTVLV